MSVVQLREAETLAQTAAEINKQLALSDKEQLKGNDCIQRAKYARVYAGHMLKGAKKRVDDGESELSWAQWCKKYIKDRTMRDIQKLIKIASSENPEEAAEEERNAAKERMRKHRHGEQGDVRRVPKVVRDAMILVRAMTPDELACFEDQFEAFKEEGNG